MSTAFSRKIKSSVIIILLFALMMPLVNFNHHIYENKEGVIIWDIKSYYAYLPATFIYKDLSFEFRDEYPERHLHDWIWTSETPTGKQAVITSMGLSFLYAPFFFIAHGVALIHPDYDAYGYSKPYHIALTFSALIYFLLALFLLRKLLLKRFNERITAMTLFVIGAGTNLFYYISYEAPMSHAYNFFLIILFIFLLDKWMNKITLKHSIYVGLVAGLIALVRPTNIVVLLAIPLFGVSSFKSLKDNIWRLVQNWPNILLMAASFIVVWIPQFAYWYYVSGKLFYFSYAEAGGKFFFSDPQLFKMLFSYEKGWYVYTPVMLFATAGLYRMYRIKHELFWPVLTILIIQIYVLASWWSWWFGGAFGNRSMIDIYGLMAFPLATFMATKWRYKLISYLSIGTIFVLTVFNQFQVQQYRHGAIHYWWNNKACYWANFLQLKPTCKYWKVVQIPDYDLARKGIYRSLNPVDKNEQIPDSLLVNCVEDKLFNSIDFEKNNRYAKLDSLGKQQLLRQQALSIVENHRADHCYRELQTENLRNYINNCADWRKELEKTARKSKLPYEEILDMEANKIFEEYTPSYRELN